MSASRMRRARNEIDAAITATVPTEAQVALRARIALAFKRDGIRMDEGAQDVAIKRVVKRLVREMIK